MGAHMTLHLARRTLSSPATTLSDNDACRHHPEAWLPTVACVALASLLIPQLSLSAFAASPCVYDRLRADCPALGATLLLRYFAPAPSAEADLRCATGRRQHAAAGAVRQEIAHLRRPLEG